jgi:hypothetical protein
MKRFWNKVKKTDSCWLWMGARHAFGYGMFAYSPDRIMTAHRASWIITHGVIGPNLQVCHSCDNPPCINPAHLFLGTKADNSRDMAVKARGTAKFSHAQIREIRSLTPTLTQRQIAKRFGVSQPAIGFILRREHYAHVED